MNECSLIIIYTFCYQIDFLLKIFNNFLILLLMLLLMLALHIVNICKIICSEDHISTNFYSDHIPHIILWNVVHCWFSTQKHHNLIHESHALDIIHSCLRCLFPVWKLFYFVPHHCDFVVNFIYFLVQYLFVLACLWCLVLGWVKCLISECFHSIRNCL